MSRTRALISRLGRLLFLGVASLTLSEQTLRAQLLDEYKVKAAFLYNFTKFVEWPQQAFRSPGDPLTICILGENPFGSALTEMANASTLNGRRVGEREIRSTQEANGCQILFISSSERYQVRAIMKELQGASILTVGDVPGFARLGTIVDFILQDNKVRFEFNTAAAARAQLKISSKLLSLANIVR